MRPTINQLGSAASVYAASAILTRAARFLLIPVYVRYLEPAEVGIVVVLEAVIVVLSRALPLSLGQAVRRFYSEYAPSGRADAFTAGLWWLSLGASAAGSVVLLVGGWILLPASWIQFPAVYLAAAVGIAVLTGNLNVLLQRFVAAGAPGRHGAVTFARFITTTGLIVYFVVFQEMGVAGVLVGELLGGALSTLAALLFVSRLARPLLDRAVLTRAVRYAAPLVPHAVFTWGLAFADRLILERFVALEAVGLYGVGYRLASVVSVVSLALINAWIRFFLREGGSDGAAAAYARTFTLYSAVLFAIGAAMIALRNEIIAVVATPSYGAAASILGLVAFGLVFHGLYQALLLPLFLKRRVAFISAATGGAFLVNVVLNLVLVPRWGIHGAAIATIVSYGATCALCLWTVQRVYPVPLEAGWLAATAAVGVLTVALADALPVNGILTLKTAIVLIVPAPLLTWLVAVENGRSRPTRVSPREDGPE